MMVKRNRFITRMGAAKAAISLGILGLGWLPSHSAEDAMMTARLVAAAMLIAGTVGVVTLDMRLDPTENQWPCPPNASSAQAAEIMTLTSRYGFLTVIGVLSVITFFASPWLPEDWAGRTILLRQISSVALAGAFLGQSMVIVRRDRLLAALSK